MEGIMMNDKNGRFIVNSTLNILLDKIPAVGSIMQTLNDERFARRLEEHKEKIEDIVTMVPSEERKYFLDKVGRTVLERIEADDEDDKVEYLLIGFENCVKRQITKEGMILSLFDLVSALRMNDLRILHCISTDQSQLDKDDESVRLSINNLLNQRIISVSKMTWELIGEPDKIYSSDFKITSIGEILLKFIRSDTISS